MKKKNELNQNVEKNRIIDGLQFLSILWYYNNMNNAVENIVKSKKLTYKEKFKRLKEIYLSIDSSSIGDLFRRLMFWILISLYNEEGIKIARRLYNALINDKDIKKKSKVKMSELK